MSALLTRQVRIGDEEFETLARLVHGACGVVLSSEHKPLVLNRLAAVLDRERIDSFARYCALVTSDVSGRLLSELVNRISTNHTFFNREPAHFQFLKTTVLPDLISRGRVDFKKKLRVWCAACSTGQEAYMLVMTMMEALGNEYGAWDAGVLATDVSTNALDAARVAVYPEDQLAKLPAGMRRYFERTAEGRYRASEPLRKEVTFRRFNLVTGRQQFRDPFDVIFCRNVLIYFDAPTRRGVAKRLHHYVRPGGFVFVGSAESFPDPHPFLQIAAGIYQRQR